MEVTRHKTVDRKCKRPYMKPNTMACHAEDLAQTRSKPSETVKLGDMKQSFKKKLWEKQVH